VEFEDYSTGICPFMRDKFWIGVYPGLTEEMIDFILQKIREFVKAKS
jgi:hypothetical protein